MRSLKTSGGITRGRFISPSTIAKWVHSMPGTSRLIDAMETFNGVVRITSEQPVALLESNQRHSDIRNLVKPAQPVSASVTSSRISREWCCGQRSCQLRRCSVLWRSVHEGYGRDAAQCNSPAANEQCPVISKCDEGGESTRRGVCFNPTYWFHRIVYRKGKRLPFRKLQAQPALCTVVQVCNDDQTSRNAIAATCEAFLCVVYGGKIDDHLDVKIHQLDLRP